MRTVDNNLSCNVFQSFIYHEPKFFNRKNMIFFLWLIQSQAQLRASSAIGHIYPQRRHILSLEVLSKFSLSGLSYGYHLHILPVDFFCFLVVSSKNDFRTSLII